MTRLPPSLAAGALLACAGALGAQAPEPLTLERAITLATTTGPAAQAAAGRRATAVGRARADAQWANPVVELRRENEGAPIPYDDFVTVTWPVDLTGRRFALRGALGAARERGAADSVALLRGAGFSAAHAWWEAWVAGELAAFTAAQAARFADLARYDSLRAAEGEAAGAAALRTRLEAERARYAAGLAAGHAARARATLAALIGRDDGAGLLLDSTGADGHGARPARAARGTAASPGGAALPTPEEAVTRALASRPDVAAARAAAREAERRLAAERRATLPDVGLSGGYKGTGGYATAQFGLVVTPPLFNLNGGNRERAAGEWMLAESERRATELRAAADARAALAAAEAIAEATRGLDAAFAARADTVALAAEAAYREGAATLTELLEAQRARADARAAGVRAIADRALARLDLLRALGASPSEP